MIKRKHRWSLQARLRDRLDEAPQDPCLAFVDRKLHIRWINFRDFYLAAASRSTIMSEYGMKQGQVCVIVAHSDVFCAETVMACLLGGALPLLVAPPVVGGLHSNLREVVQHVVRKTGASIVVSGEEDADLIGSLSPRVHVLTGPDSTATGDAASANFAYPNGDDVAAMQLTSGTTGFPRVCIWKQKAVLAALDGMAHAMALAPQDICVNWTPMYHDMGLVNNFLLCLIQRIPLVMINTFDFIRQPSLWLLTLSKAKATISWAPNFGYAITAQRVRDNEIEGIRLDRMRGLWNAAERIHLETVLAFQKRFESYGLSLSAMKTNLGCAESIGGATFSDPHGQFIFENVDRKILHEKNIAIQVPKSSDSDLTVSVVGVGRPFPGVKLKICAPNGRTLTDGHVGEITLQTPSSMIGYLRDARSTNRAIKGKFLRTGDLGYLRGKELFWVGRSKERINLHGEKLDPSDFEKVLLRIEGVREGCFAAFGIDDPKSGTQRLVIVTEVRDHNNRANEEILDEIRARVVREVGVTVNEVILLKQGTMSKTSSGKRRHRFYRDLYLQNALKPIALLRK